MTINKELIEKYHNGTCSAAEKATIEKWLMSDESEDEFVILNEQSRLQLQTELWEEIALVLPSNEKESSKLKASPTRSTSFRRLAAAAILITVLGSALYIYKFSAEKPDIIVMNNSSGTINKSLVEKEYTISVGPKSNVEINNQTGLIDFCGAMMINPKRDMEFTIQGTCSKTTDSSEKMILKKGLNYIALNYNSNTKANEVIIVEEGSMTGLPPLVMKQLLQQFNI